jgi:hypothetical protein
MRGSQVRFLPGSPRRQLALAFRPPFPVPASAIRNLDFTRLLNGLLRF